MSQPRAFTTSEQGTIAAFERTHPRTTYAVWDRVNVLRIVKRTRKGAETYARRIGGHVTVNAPAAQKEG